MPPLVWILLPLWNFTPYASCPLILGILMRRSASALPLDRTPGARLSMAIATYYPRPTWAEEERWKCGQGGGYRRNLRGEDGGGSPGGVWFHTDGRARKFIVLNPKFATSLKSLRLWRNRIWQFQVSGKISPEISFFWLWISDRPRILIIKRAFYSQIYPNCQTPFLPFWIFLGREAPLKIKWQTWVKWQWALSVAPKCNLLKVGWYWFTGMNAKLVIIFHLLKRK